MSELGDRLLIMVIAVTGFAVLVAGWAGGLVEASLGGVSEVAVLGVLGLAFLVVIVAIWRGMEETETRDSE